MQSLWMLLAALFFASMGVCVKIASAWFNSAELMLWRGLISVLLLWVLARAQRVPLATPYPAMHAWRSLVGSVSLGTWFYAIAGLPLGTAMTLNYMSSVWIAAFIVGGALVAWRPRTGERVPLGQAPLLITVLAGFAGVVMLLQPTMQDNQLFAGLVGLFSGITAALAYMQVMVLGRLGEHELRTVFYFAVGSVVAGAVALPFMGLSPWDSWQWQHGLWLLPIGALATGGQLCMTRAYSKGATLVVANLQYSGIVFGALFGMVLFAERITPLGWIGMLLITASGIAATALRTRAAPDSPAEEH